MIPFIVFPFSNIFCSNRRHILSTLQFLNSSLEKCESKSKSLIQDIRLSDFSNELQTVDTTVTDHDGKINRSDQKS